MWEKVRQLHWSSQDGRVFGQGWAAEIERNAWIWSYLGVAFIDVHDG